MLPRPAIAAAAPGPPGPVGPPGPPGPVGVPGAPGSVVSVTSAVPEWLQITAAAGTTLATVFGALAAFAAIRAAAAATRQARQSTEAANRALEALGRALAPESLQVAAWIGPQPIGDQVQLTSPTLLSVQVRNTGPHPADAVTVTVTPAGGLPRLLTPTRRLIPAGEHTMFELADMALTTIDHPVDHDRPTTETQARAEHLITVTYSDVRGLLRWRRHVGVTEVLVSGHRQQGNTVHPERIAYRLLTDFDPQDPELAPGTAAP